jgi:hypothetical protein
MRISLLSVAGLALALMGCAVRDPQLTTTAQLQDSPVTAKPVKEAGMPRQKQSIQRVPEAEPLLMSQR